MVHWVLLPNHHTFHLTGVLTCFDAGWPHLFPWKTIPWSISLFLRPSKSPSDIPKRACFLQWDHEATARRKDQHIDHEDDVHHVLLRFSLQMHHHLSLRKWLERILARTRTVLSEELQNLCRGSSHGVQYMWKWSRPGYHSFQPCFVIAPAILPKQSGNPFGGKTLQQLSTCRQHPPGFAGSGKLAKGEKLQNPTEVCQSLPWEHHPRNAVRMRGHVLPRSTETTLTFPFGFTHHLRP